MADLKVCLTHYSTIEILKDISKLFVHHKAIAPFTQALLLFLFFRKVWWMKAMGWS